MNAQQLLLEELLSHTACITKPSKAPRRLCIRCSDEGSAGPDAELHEGDGGAGLNVMLARGTSAKCSV